MRGMITTAKGQAILEKTFHLTSVMFTKTFVYKLLSTVIREISTMLIFLLLLYIEN